MPKQMGEIIVDHRASPGIPEDLALQLGYDPATVAEGKILKTYTLHCSHCGGHGIPNPWRTRPRALCMECNNREGHYICDACDFERSQPGYVHNPEKKQIDDKLESIVRMGSPSKLLLP